MWKVASSRHPLHSLGMQAPKELGRLCIVQERLELWLPFVHSPYKEKFISAVRFPYKSFVSALSLPVARGPSGPFVVLDLTSAFLSRLRYRQFLIVNF